MFNLEIQQNKHNVGSQHLSSHQCWSATVTGIVSKERGEKIKAARKRSKLTLKQLGEKIGRSYSTLSQIESGAETEKATLIALAKELQDNFGESWLDEYINELSGTSKKELVKDMTAQEFVSLKFGGKNTRRSRAELDMLTRLLDAELERINKEEQKYGSE